MLRLITLGAVDLRDGRGRPVQDILAQPKRVALLTYLALEGRSAPVPRDRLLALFWPESDEARARNALSQSLHHLRRSLGDHVIESQGANAVLVQGSELWCDATAFTEALERGESELALDLYRGEFCPALSASGSSDFEHWLDGERGRLRRLALKTAQAVAEKKVDAGDNEGAARLALRALALHPDDEADLRSLLLILERAGDVSGALHAYRLHAERLQAELDAEPEPGTVRLIEAMRGRRDASAATDALPRGAVATTDAEPRVRLRRTPFLVTGVALALALIGGVTALLWPGRRFTGTPIRTLAVVPFTVRGPALAYLRDGMVDLLSAKLEGVSGFRAVDPRSVIAGLTHGDSGSVPDANAIARATRSLGAGWYIRGEVISIAGRLQLDASLVDVERGNTVVTASVSGDTAALFELVDDLSGRILAGLVPGRDTTLTSLAAMTTHSLPALKAFLRGEEALRAGRDAQAAAAFREAADLDTSFALAQYRLAVTATWVVVPDAGDPTAWAAKAARHAGRLTPLGRDLLNAYQAYRDVRTDEAERLYTQLTEAYPENVEAWMMLAETRFHYNSYRGRSPLEAWAMFQRVLALEPSNAHAMVHLARLAALDGRLGALDSLVQHYLERHADAERELEMRALRAYARNDPAERAQVLRAARSTNDFMAMSLLQAAAIYAQNLDAARELAGPFMHAVTNPRVLTLGRRHLSDLGLAGGQWAREPSAQGLGKALDDEWRLDGQLLIAADPFFPVPLAAVARVRDSLAAGHLSPAPSTFGWQPDRDLRPDMQRYFLGLLSVRLGDTAAARRYAEELAAVRDPKRAGPAHDLARGLRAELARAQGNPREALAELDGFPFDLLNPGGRNVGRWGVRERFLRAELLLSLGREEEALAWYDSFAGPEDLPYLAAAHLRRAQIHARLGHRERAQFHYGRFVALWQNCDPEFREMVTTARAALSR